MKPASITNVVEAFLAARNRRRWFIRNAKYAGENRDEFTAREVQAIAELDQAAAELLERLAGKRTTLPDGRIVNPKGPNGPEVCRP